MNPIAPKFGQIKVEQYQQAFYGQPGVMVLELTGKDVLGYDKIVSNKFQDQKGLRAKVSVLTDIGEKVSGPIEGIFDPNGRLYTDPVRIGQLRALVRLAPITSEQKRMFLDKLAQWATQLGFNRI